jgi:hypothetical protein
MKTAAARPAYTRGRYSCAECGKLGHNARNKRFHGQKTLPAVPLQPELKLSRVA